MYSICHCYIHAPWNLSILHNIFWVLSKYPQPKVSSETKTPFHLILVTKSKFKKWAKRKDLILVTFTNEDGGGENPKDLKYHKAQGTNPGETVSRRWTTKREKLRKTEVKRNDKRGKGLKYQRRQGTNPKLRMKLWRRQKPTKSSDQFPTREKNRFRHSDKRRENLEGIGRQCKQVRTNTNRPFSLFQDIAES